MARSPLSLREARVALFMTQAELAQRAQLAVRTVHSTEATGRCRQDTKRALLRALGVPFSDSALYSFGPAPRRRRLGAGPQAPRAGPPLAE